jgi:N utilization substance protein A
MAKDIADANPEVLSQIPGIDATRIPAMQEAAKSRMVNDSIELEQLEKDREARRLEEQRKHPDDLTQDERMIRVTGIGSSNLSAFKLSGYSTVEDVVKEADLTRLGNVAGIGIKKARQVKSAAERYLQEEAKKRAELDALKGKPPEAQPSL